MHERWGDSGCSSPNFKTKKDCMKVCANSQESQEKYEDKSTKDDLLVKKIVNKLNIYKIWQKL